jgi:hypothetical protein
VADATQQIRTVPDYLEQLRRELAESDPALVQDALSDAEGYLNEETAAAASDGAATADREAALADAIRRFGTPREVAEAYRETEARVAAALAQPARPPAAGLGQRIFGVFLDPKAYGSLLFMLLSLPTGILYFTWAVTGVALSLGLSVLVIGLPFILAFVASMKIFALIEGRLIESMTGLRMPRRPPATREGGSLLTRLGRRLADPRTWSTLAYLVLSLPLGVLSFSLAVSMLALSLSLLAAPIAGIFFDEPAIFLHGHAYVVNLWGLPLFWLAGFLDLLLTMHLARGMGRLYGAIAKAMLVSS